MASEIAARGLELGAAGNLGHRLAHLLGRHVVEEDPRSAGLDRLGHLVDRLRLDLDGQPETVLAERCERRR